MSRNNLSRVIISALISLLLPLYAIKIIGAEGYFFAVLGKGLIDPKSYFLSIAAAFLPTVSLLLFWGEFIQNDYLFMGDYLFTRTNKRWKFAAKASLNLLLWVVLYYIFFLLGTFMIFFANGGRLSACDFEILLLSVPLDFLFVYSLLLIQNIATLFVRSVYSYFTILILYIGSVLTLIQLKAESLQRTLFIGWPFVQNLYAWHELSHPVPDVFPPRSLAGFTIVQSYLYLVALLVTVCCVGLFAVSRMDILGKKREA